MKPALVISLDFELHYGVSEGVKGPEHPYWSNIEGAREAIPHLLELFHERGIHATWATVGKLFARGAEDLEKFRPTLRPQYQKGDVDTYALHLGKSEEDDPLHFAPSLIRQILHTPGQELASHTFCHYYCDEPGQDLAAFRADLEAAQAIAARDGVNLRSLVFPRNQVLPDYLAVLPEVGVQAYRGNPPRGMYHTPAGRLRRYLVRGLRLLDSYINLTGHHTVPWASIAAEYSYNVRASRFLRPYSHKMKFLEPLRRRRVVQGLKAAAKRGEIFHLWWHPHNFGAELKANIAGLEAILDEFERLRENQGMQSLNMGEILDSKDLPPGA